MGTLLGMSSLRSSALALLCGLSVTSCQLAGRNALGEVALKLGVPSKGPAFELALYQTVGVELTGGNDVEWNNNGAVFDAMVKEIGLAKADVNIVTFIWAGGKASGRLLKALADAHTRGVACRVIIDSVGSLSFDDAPVRAAGCEVRRFRPVPGQDDLARNHRKILVVDGKVGFVGGFGIDDKWLGSGQKEEEWRDSNVRVTGPVVRELQQAFAENWQEVGGKLLPERCFPHAREKGGLRAALVKSSGNAVVTTGDKLMQLLIASAQKRLWIANAYFVPSEPILELLEIKAKQGVDVRVLSAGEKTDTRVYLPDQRARVARLLKIGVRAFEYEPTMMHAKTVLVDEELYAVGSLNLDALSLNKMEEDMVVALDRDTAKELAADFLDDLKRSLEVKLPKDPNQRVSMR